MIHFVEYMVAFIEVYGCCSGDGMWIRGEGMKFCCVNFTRNILWLKLFVVTLRCNYYTRV